MQFWFLMITIFYTILTTPYHFYPAEVRCSVGLFHELGISSRYQLYLINVVYGLINACILFIPSHSVFSTAALIIFNVPYRVFVKKMLNMGTDTTNRVATVSS
ncbi:hypothetical protein L3Y34_015750 [Caenorhabditis briggsae]|uniref:Uncharacterized protein n=1 Tax=Caenorhabditis briggsae TaxID=6238 RepID=A0AAE9DUJ4_CAEBR|nr:hypothetical protein L3Y34_015750 [Caenorhabditis briggsae]